MMRSRTVRFEQAVYGSFPFWDRGYAVLAQSPGCRPGWLSGLRAACQGYGERPPGAAEAGGLFAMRTEDGTWMVVGVGPQGCDDRGRPGALAFHALFLTPREYRRAGLSPFALAHALRLVWDAGVRDLPSGCCTVGPASATAPPDGGPAARIAAALSRGRRVAVQAPGPIDETARQAWAALPERVRRRASVASWAFGNANRFDLVALPRLAGVALDPSYITIDLESEAAGSPPAPAPVAAGGGSWRVPRGLPALGAVAVLAGVGLGVAWHRSEEGAGRPVATATGRAAPDPSDYRDGSIDPDERRRVAEALADLAERFGVVEARATPGEADPVALMIAMADRLRYRGPFLSADELSRLGSEAGRDRDLALRWHERVRRFADDRPLPEGFARGNLRWQLDTLSWSFHLDDPSARRRSAAEVPHAIGEALATDVPLRATPLSARYPALASYAAFLGRLPSR
jgi:hypothetical protein